MAKLRKCYPKDYSFGECKVNRKKAKAWGRQKTWVLKLEQLSPLNLLQEPMFEKNMTS